MSHKPIDPKDFEGKTIARLEAGAVNIIRFYFTDGTSKAIEVEALAPTHGIYGMVSCDDCAEEEMAEYDAFNDKGDARARDVWVEHKPEGDDLQPRPGEGVSIRPAETIIWVANPDGVVHPNVIPRNALNLG